MKEGIWYKNEKWEGSYIKFKYSSENAHHGSGCDFEGTFYEDAAFGKHDGYTKATKEEVELLEKKIQPK